MTTLIRTFGNNEVGYSYTVPTNANQAWELINPLCQD